MFTCWVSISSFAQTIEQDTTLVKKDTTKLKYSFNHFKSGGLFLKNPSEMEIILDTALDKYVVVEKVGDYYVRTPIFMSPKEYEKYRLERDMLDYFKNKVSATNGKRKGAAAAQKDLLPTYYVNKNFFKSLFGSSAVKITPTGSVNLKLGFIYQNTENPQLSEKSRSNFTLDVDQQVSVGLQAQIGTRLNASINYDTQSTFDFQNLIKLQYTPTEDDIIQELDAGNVTMPIKNSLINGAQSLFGVKGKFKFGKTNITAVFSQQNSESKTVTAQAGASIQPFEIRATDYDNDRHFFLAHYFRNNYAKSLENYPLITSSVNITRIEVWITNRNASTQDFRSIVAFADIGEAEKQNLVDDNGRVIPEVNQAVVSGSKLPFNEANSIYTNTTILNGIRDVSNVEGTLGGLSMEQGTDYSVLQNAIKLTPDEYTLNSQLGYISLNRRLNDGEVLAVAYEYTVAGNVTGIEKNTFKVGEFSNDGIEAPNNLAVKLLRSEILTTKRTVDGVEEAFPIWQLMMKNIYPLGAYPLSQDGFYFEIQYRDDKTGIPSNTLQNAKTAGIANNPLIQVFNLDQLDQSQFQKADGFFDYVEGITVDSQNGYVIFPTPEPFGTNLEQKLTDQEDKDIYVFDELYLNTKINIKNNYQNKDKFLLKGYFKSENSGGIPLNAFNVPRGSVTVTAGGRQLVEGVDFVVDYSLGRVKILDPSLEASGTPIQVSTESNSVFNPLRKTFTGIEAEHQFSEDFIIGATYLNVSERPLTPKVNFGTEPIDNTMLGFSLDYSSEIPLFTKLANKLPFVDTDQASNISVRTEMAYLIPGTPSGIDVAGAATSYIDDFEASQSASSLLSPLEWHLASTPKTTTLPELYGATNTDPLSYNYKRAKLAWYTIDPIFYGLGDTPSNIDAEELSRAETRQITYTELFPNTDLDITQTTLIQTLDLAYFPTERGSYNFNPKDDEVEIDATNDKVILKKPEENWGGIMRPLTTNNFDQANVEYIQFWMMDPYERHFITTDEADETGLDPKNPANQGDLYFNLGNISEDINKDNAKMYENGLPTDGTQILSPNLGANVRASNFFGVTPINPSILYVFDEDDAARINQDVGLDGLNNEKEKLQTTIDAKFRALQDPAGDDFQYYRSSDLDATDASIIKRYKNFNNTQGNSPTINQSTETYPISASTYPDVEDINKDQTMNTVESFYEYKVSLKSTDLEKGKNFIVDKKTTLVTLKDGDEQNTTWYQFRIPIRGGKAINNISDFNSIRFIRMFVTNFKVPVVLRFGELDLVRGDWRRYTKTLDPTIAPEVDLTPQEINEFEIGVVNIEQNEARYVLPPSIQREQLQGSNTVQFQNEQSLTLKVDELKQNKIRAVYKNISVDLRRSKQLKMFTHVEPLIVGSVEDNEMATILRLGTDLNDNFYQIEIPLKVSKKGSLSPTEVWPEANNLEATLEEFGKVKLERDAIESPISELYTSVLTNGLKVSVKGNPTLATIRTIMLGVKNTSALPKSAEVWFNELRSAGFDNDGGWAAIMSADANFADVANVSISGRMQTVGFGNVEDRAAERSLHETKQYDVATNVDLGKVISPKKWGIQLPMSYSVGEELIDPKFDPQYQDVILADALEQNPNSEFSRDYTKRTSISFMNVRKNRNPKSTKKPRLYDVENLSVSYAHNKEFHRDYNIEKYINETVTASAGYNFNFKSKPIEPFKKLDSLEGKYWQWFKDINFNFIPTTFAINSRVNRNYNEQQSRSLVAGLFPQPKLTQRRFLFDWDYSIAFNLTKSLQLNFNATNSHIYNIFDEEEVQVFDKFFNTGTPNQYRQTLNSTYRVPLNKIPFLDFIKADVGYTADFDWQVVSQDPAIANKIGNTIQNANTKSVNTDVNFAKLYKTLGLEKLLKLPKSTSNKSVKKSTKKLPLGKKILKGFYDVVTSVKTGKLSYAENNGQSLPGYSEGIGFLGGAPTAFAFGNQTDIRTKALQNNWLVVRDENDEYINKTYNRTQYQKLNYNFTVKPFKNFNIDVIGNNIKTRNLSQLLDVSGIRNRLGELENITIDENIKPIETGNFSTSFAMISTAFSNGDDLFQNMKDYRSIISERLVNENYSDISKFKGNSQQVLLPAFLAAYSGQSPNKVGTGLFKNIPIPNWTLRYNGFMEMKWFQKNLSSFTLSHGYKSSYTLSSFTNNLNYVEGNAIVNQNSQNYEPELLIAAATLVDEFSPLIQVDMKMKSSFSFRGEIKKDRALSMNFNNSTLTDIKGIEYVFGFGYALKDLKFSTRFTGKKQTLRGDLNLRADISLRDNLTLIRSIEDDSYQINDGQRILSIKFAADYRLSSNLTTSFYYNHQTSKYAISTTFPRQAINAGFNIIYNLGN